VRTISKRWMGKISALAGMLILMATSCNAQATGQQLYTHKVSVDSIIQTRAYTYLMVTEKLNGKDSSQWMAMPLFDPKIGETYYYTSGLQMGEFKSKELDRTFDQILFMGCLSTTPEVSAKTIVPQPVVDTTQTAGEEIITHTVEVKEVLQTSGYTYLLVKENEKEEWLAGIRINAAAGQFFTYDDASVMTDFKSRELNRTFNEILFVAKLTPVSKDAVHESPSKVKINPKNIREISISALVDNKEKYSGRIVKVAGKVTKYSSNILGKNWVHIEDESSAKSRQDLTLTTDKELKVGDIITAYGEVQLNKNFGSGYFFDVIIEDATVKKAGE